MKAILCKRTAKKPIGNRFSAALIGMSIILSASAATDESPQKISLSDAVTMTLTHHPDLQAFVSQQRVWEGRIQQASVGERPEIGLMIEDALGTGEHSALKSVQSTLTFSWLLQQDLIDSRVNTVKTEATKLVIEKQIKALDLSSQVAKHFIDILVKQEHLKLNVMAKAQAENVVDTIAKRVQAGKSSAVEMQLAKAEFIRRGLAVEDIEHELKASQYQLASLWGKPKAAYYFNGDLLGMPTVPSVDSQLTLLKQNPRFQQFASAQRIAQSQMELARIEAKPQWQFTAGVRRYEASDDFGLVAGVSIPWGTSDRNAGTIAALHAQQDVLVNEQSALMQAQDAQLYVLLQEMAHSAHVIDTVRNSIVPTLEKALSEASNAFDKGQLSYNQYNDVYRELLSAQYQLLDAFESLHLQHIEIQRLTGTSISQ
ncbi:MAG: TolC family protein [Shewanella xiamenensis]|jgi:cobalt-zinc-cadmium efflux system outer membrane protein|uniref:TolC family protein n=1 Tax=Shewanella TaxID=22 RepID=UPI000DB0DF96|nr:TolC family protein [Shewanella baltica]MCD8552013.1 TolC family protein [Shewanella xiamenensis]PZP30309.1 MAG: TolC family protein [Shewanella oneidensis]MCD8561444.1 TolC family protein [Shewanella xiamenensis]MCS6151604.1 TolC family protein [Shewanella baltica]MCS6173138.1 TolC family protein [Shewanella baltica]